MRRTSTRWRRATRPGASCTSGTFSPKFVEREYLDKFPGWSRVEVTTGWLTARVDGAGRRRRAHRDRSRAVLGLLPGEGAAADLRPRDEGDRRQADGRQAAVPPRPRHRGVDERAGRADRHRRGAGLVARGAARGHLLRHARLLRGDGADAHEEPPERAGQGVPHRPPGAAGQAGRGPGSLRRQRVDEGEARGHLQGEGRRQAHRRLARPVADRHDRRRACSARSSRDDRVSEIELQVEAKDDKEATRAVDALDGLVEPAGGRPLQDGALVRPRRSRGGGGRAQGRADAARREEHGSVDAVERAHGAAGRGRRLTWPGTTSSARTSRSRSWPALAASPEVHSFKVGQSYRGRDISAMEITLPVAERTGVDRPS